MNGYTIEKGLEEHLSLFLLYNLHVGVNHILELKPMSLLGMPNEVRLIGMNMTYDGHLGNGAYAIEQFLPGGDLLFNSLVDTLRVPLEK